MLNDAEHAARRAVDRLIGRVAQRLRLRRAFLALLAALAGGGLATAVAFAVARAFGAAPSAAWVGAALSSAAVAGAVAAAWPVPWQDAARRIEARRGARAPCRATREVLARGARNRVERALLARAVGWSNEIDPRDVVPRPQPPRWAWLVVAAWASVAAAAVVPLPVLGVGPLPAGGTAQDPGALWILEEAETIAKLERFADLLYREAAVREDAAVRALAERTEALGDRLLRGDLSSTQAATEFEALAGDVASTLGYADDPTYRTGDGLGDDGVGAGARPATNRERAAATLGQERREEIGTTRAPEEGERVLDSLLERLETEAIARATAAADADLSEVQFRPGVGATESGNVFDNPYDDPNAGAPLDAASTTDAARPDLGGAAAGDAAGLGGAEAGGLAQDWATGRDPARALDELDVELDAVALPERAPPGARRLRVLAPPPSNPVGPAGDGPAGPPPPWTWGEEAFLGGYAVDPTDRRLLAAAFHPNGEATDE